LQATDNLNAGLESDLALIREAAEEAGGIALSFFRHAPDVWMKDGRSPVSAADLAVNHFLLERLGSARPDYGWLSEETADSPARLSARRTFIVDPIDGTRAFLDHKPVWGISIAIVENGRGLAAVLACPALAVGYWAAKGGGAFRNGERIAVRKLGPEIDIAGPRPMIAALVPPQGAVLRPHAYVPSLAVRLAMVAEGRLDATFVKSRSHHWDIAAADLILEEAGGLILDERGQRPLLAGPNPRLGPLAAGSGPLLEAMTRVIGSFRED
jgi:myo-inositol-1(or 4)-monophosphatase